MVAAVLGSELPVWIRSTRKATKEEDAQGIDFVIETDKGAVYLQVKSSKAAAEKFVKRHSAARHLVIAAIVVLDATTPENLRKQVLYRLTMLREKLMDGSLMEWLRERSGLATVIDQALRAAVRDYGDIGNESTRVAAVDVAEHLRGWVGREIGIRMNGSATDASPPSASEPGGA